MIYLSEFNVHVTLTSQSSYNRAQPILDSVNDLMSRPANKTTNSCSDKPGYKQAYFTYFHH